LNIVALRHALNSLVARHESLRTTFESVDGRPRQVVHPPYEIAVSAVDAPGETELRRLMDTETARPFDLGNGPLMRVMLARKVARRKDTTLFMTLVAACQLLLHRWSGQDDVAVGTVTSGRDHAEVEGLVGIFVNTLVLRSHVDGRRSFVELLADVRRTVLDAF